MDTKIILKLKQETGAGIMKAKQILDECDGDYEKAKKILTQQGVDKAASKSDREIKAGLVYSYVHGGGETMGGKIGVIVKVGCETDFVAKTSDFNLLCKELAMQISAMGPKNVKELLTQEYIRDNSKTIEVLIKETIAKVGENIVVVDFSRLEV
jgi:elongation factor Ts